MNSMSQDWAEITSERILNRGFIRSGICLFLGAVDTGKTSLIVQMALRLAQTQPVGIVDADIGQSHIGPPAAVGWTIADNPSIDFASLDVRGISFVGDITPAGHLLQLTAGVTRCFQQALQLSELILIDTPGFAKGSAAAALWWSVQKILQPQVIIAAQRENELTEVLAGLKSLRFKLELIEVPREIPLKSPQERQNYRQQKFREYFRGASIYKIRSTDVAIQTSGYGGGYADSVGRLVGLRDASGNDLAVGLVVERQSDNIIVIKSPQVDINKVSCVIIGYATVDIDI